MTRHQQVISILIFIVSCSQHDKVNLSELPKSLKKDSLEKRITYQGRNFVSKSWHSYTLNWFKTDSIHFLIMDEDSVGYEEMWGSAKKINDSIYYIRCDKILYHMGMEDHGDIQDTFRFMCDKSLIGNDFKITYHDNSSSLYKITSDDNSFKIDRKLFNKKNPYIKIKFGYINPISNNTLELYSSYNSASRFSYDNYPKNVYVILKDNKVKSLNFNSGEMLDFELINVR